MNKFGSDPKVKKTLVRNIEQRVKSSRKQVVHDVACSSTEFEKENELGHPTLCSSEALANYLSDVKKSLPAPLKLSEENDNVDKGQVTSKITKNLNFHFNDRIYKNLVELNARVEDTKSRKDRRPPSVGTSKRDIEPKIEDFYEDEKEIDSPPKIPVVKPKHKAVKYVENGHMHKLVASFEDL